MSADERDGPGPGDTPGQDLIGSGTEEPGPAERLREEIERSGAVAWARRHRPLLAGSAGLLLLVAVGAVYLVTRPPAPDPVVHVSVVASRDGTRASADFDAQGRARGTWVYIVSTRVAGDVDDMVGVVGPGLTDPTSTVPHVTADRLGTGSLGATADCSDQRWWTALDAAYRARVHRTDTYDRQTTYDVPLGPPTDTLWHNRVRQACLRSFLPTLPPATAAATAVPGTQLGGVAITLTNRSPHAVWVSAAFVDAGGVTWGARALPGSSGSSTTADGPWTPLPAGGIATVTVAILAVDCTSGTPGVPLAAAASGSPGTSRALPLLVTDSASPVEEQVAGSWATLDQASTARVDGWLAEHCVGAR